VSIPEVSAKGNTYTLKWVEEHLQIVVSHIHAHKDGRVTSELVITTDREDYNYPHLLQTSFNLTAARSRTELAKKLATKYEEVNQENFDYILEQLCLRVLERFRAGEEVVELWTNEEIATPSYKLAPLLAENKANILFGDPGSGKSTLALLFAVILQLPWQDNPFGLQPKSSKVLYLDWETDHADMSYVLSSLIHGLDLPEFFISYRRCFMRLADDIEPIRKIVEDGGIDTVIIDSAGLACGGDLNLPEPVTMFFSALRSLSTTSIIIHHTTKEAKRHKSPFGSHYFVVQARTIYEIRSSQEPDSNVLHVGLFHYKKNIGGKINPMGFRFTYEGNVIYTELEDVKNVPAFSGDLPVSIQIKEELNDGPKTIVELAELLDKKQDTISRTMRRLRDGGSVVKLPEHKWGRAV